MSDFSYLNTEALRTRQILAAHAVRDCRHILEIGGGMNPISMFVHSFPKAITVVDPAIQWPNEFQPHNPCTGAPCSVRHLPIRIEDYKPTDDADGLVMLGFEGEGHCDLDVVCKFIEKARVVVIEASCNHAPAVRAIGRILAAKIHPVDVHLRTTYRGANVPEGHRFCERNFYVLRAKS